MTKVIFCGDRNWLDQELVYRVLAEFSTKDTIVITGGATGLDMIAGSLAYQHGYPWAEVRPGWNVYGKAAGPIRNGWMLDLQPDLVIAFHDDIENSKGTKNCVEQAKKRGIPIRMVSHVSTSP